MNEHGTNMCYWCGAGGWIRRCGRCGFWTCDACWKPHNADMFEYGQRRYRKPATDAGPAGRALGGDA